MPGGSATVEPRDAAQQTLDKDAARAASLAALEWPRLLEALRERLRSPYGEQALDALHPLGKLGAVRHALALLDALGHSLSEGLRLDFAGVHSLSGLLSRAEREGRLEAAEMDAVRATQNAALRLAADLRTTAGEAGTHLLELADGLHPLRELTATLAAALTPSGTLNETTFPVLARLRAELSRRRDAIHRRLEGLLRNDRLAAVFQDSIYTLRGRRYVLPVKADFRGQLKGIVHDVSASGATLFIEPQQVVEDTNALAVAEKQLELESQRILDELSALVGAASEELRTNMAWIGRVDLLHAQARLGMDYGGISPIVEDEGVLDLRSLGHPLMLLGNLPDERVIPGSSETGSLGSVPPGPDLAVPAPHPSGATSSKTTPPPRVVRNRVRLGGETRCLVISGANTGGKTVLLKSLGLAALLVRHGMHVPAARGSRCDLFHEVWADIGDQQSLETSLSTFSAQIRFMASWLETCGPGQLVLMDEMLTGTEPGQGAALATAVLEHLLVRGATTVVTTHFGELKALAADHPGMVNGAMAFDSQRLEPTYRLEVGLPGASFAPDIARRYGMPEALVSAAERTLANRPEALDALLVATHQERRRLREREDDLQQQRERLARRRKAMEQERAGLKKREAKLERRERGEIGHELRQARKQIAEVIRGLQQANDLPRAGKVREELTALERTFMEGGRAKGVTREAPGGTSTLRGSAAPEPFVWSQGTEVWLPHLERGGVVEAVLDEGERLRVRMGALTLEVDADEAQPATASKTPAAKGAKSGKAKAPGPSQAPPPHAVGSGVSSPQREDEIIFALSTEENTLDLRGQFLEDALERAESFLDQCTYKHVSPVLVIHGHGTGRLKRGLREHLEQSPYVAGFRPGDEQEGRDGVTIIALKV